MDQDPSHDGSPSGGSSEDDRTLPLPGYLDVDEAGIPDHIGPYPVAGVLGRGGMGIVYAARDPKLKRRIAIKVLPERMTSNASALAPPSPRRHADHRSPCAVTAAISPSRAATATTRGGAGRVRKARSASGPESSRRYSEASEETAGASVGRTIAGPV